MAVNKSMKIFFEAMAGNMLPGDGSRIFNTPMGPFKWDDLQESWVNINNGFKMSNISMQDLLMMGYDSALDGDTTSAAVDLCDYILNLASPLARTFNDGNTIRTAGAAASLNPLNTTLDGIDCPITVECNLFETDGTTPITFADFSSVRSLIVQVSIDSGVNWVTLTDLNKTYIATPSSGAISLGSGNAIRTRYVFQTTTNSGEFIFKTTNISANPSQPLTTINVLV